MTELSDALQAHLEGGLTTLCHAWRITRRDGVSFGFTDHDRPLEFAGHAFRPDTGLSALALQQATGLSVDNTEAIGALSDAALTEADIEAGRFDGAEVTAWRVNWDEPAQRAVMFRGSIGELRRAGGAFQAEVRGLSDALNRPVRRVYQKPCTAVLGDRACGFDIATPGYSHERPVVEARDRGTLVLPHLPGFEVDWFARGRLDVLSGAAKGLSGAIKRDSAEGATRLVELWTPLGADVAEGDNVRLVAGCDKRFATCRLKFANGLNFQGFPDIPEEDWVMLHPARSAALSGGSRR